MSVATASDRFDRDEPHRLDPGRSIPLSLALAAALALIVVGLVAWRFLPRTPGDTSAEAGFARDMSTHHDQAVAMALMIRDRTNDPTIRTIATDIMLTQQSQIGQMRGWLDVWDLLPTGPESPMTWMGHPTHGPMPGMATPDELAYLSTLSGDEADREFLRLMIRHHEGGAPMAQAVLDRTDREVVRRLARAIVTSQTIEINTMQDLLALKGSAPPETPPSDAP